VPTDIRLDENGGDWLVLDAPVVSVTGSDLLLDSPARRAGAGGSFRRALVHDQSDGLTLNFNGDYSGGVRINDALLNVRTVTTDDGRPPAGGQVGDLVAVETRVAPGEVALRNAETSLWLCVNGPVLSVRAGSYWSRIPLAEPELVPEA
jgi:hypothetical protein